MFGCVYMFESEGARNDITPQQTASMAAATAIAAGINDRTGIRYQELTDPGNPKPVFAVLFENFRDKEQFESLFEPALKLSGLRVSMMSAPPTTAHPAELGYIDRERGYAIFIPTPTAPVQDEIPK